MNNFIDKIIFVGQSTTVTNLCAQMLIDRGFQVELITKDDETLVKKSLR